MLRHMNLLCQDQLLYNCESSRSPLARRIGRAGHVSAIVSGTILACVFRFISEADFGEIGIEFVIVGPALEVEHQKAIVVHGHFAAGLLAHQQPSNESRCLHPSC